MEHCTGVQQELCCWCAVHGVINGRFLATSAILWFSNTRQNPTMLPKMPETGKAGTVRLHSHWETPPGSGGRPTKLTTQKKGVCTAVLKGFHIQIPWANFCSTSCGFILIWRESMLCEDSPSCEPVREKWRLSLKITHSSSTSWC